MLDIFVASPQAPGLVSASAAYAPPASVPVASDAVMETPALNPQQLVAELSASIFARQRAKQAILALADAKLPEKVQRATD